MELLFSEGYSISDGIAKEDCRFQYVSMDLAVAKIMQLRVDKMDKMDIQHAYRNIPIAPTG